MTTRREPAEESRLSHDVKAKFGADPRLLMFRNNVGVLQTPNGGYLRYGLCVGSSDFVCIIRGYGVVLCLELKSKEDKTEKNRAERQRMFREMVQNAGGFAYVVRSVDDVETAITQSINAVRARYAQVTG